MSFQSRPVQPRPDHALITQRRVRSLYAPTTQSLCYNLVGAGVLSGPYGTPVLVRMGPGGLGLENDAASDNSHFATTDTTFIGPNVTSDHTMFGVVSFRSLGTNRQVLSINNSDSRFEMRVECDATTGFAYAYWANYVIGQRFSIGTPPLLNVPIAFVATLAGNASGSAIAIYLSDGTSIVSTLASTIYPSNLGWCDAFVRGDGHMYMWGHADGVWSRDAISQFLNNPFALISREVDAPVVTAADDVFPADEDLFFNDQMTGWTDFASLFPGDGSGYSGYINSGGGNSITPNGNQIAFVSNWVSGVTSKASIQKEVEPPGTDAFRWYAGDVLDVLLYLKIDGGAEDSTLLDFEGLLDYVPQVPPENTPTNSPGPRVMINNGKVCLDLSEMGGATIAGSQDCPIGSYFRLRMYLELSPESIGRTKVWVNGVLSVDHTGANMANKTTFAGLGADFNLPTFLSRIEIGVTANSGVNPTMTVTIDYAQFRRRILPKHGLTMMGIGKAVF